MNTVHPAEESRGKRALGVALSAVVGVAFIGLAVGITGPPPAGSPRVEAAAQGSSDANEARSYAEMRAHERTPAKVLPALPEAPAGPDPGARSAVTSEEKAHALEARAKLRAYDGAPPVIPHAVEQRGTASCLGCHEQGVEIGGVVAPRPSHGPLAVCTQCHATYDTPIPGEWPAANQIANSFDGLDAPAEGPRAWNIAPPQVPHSTHMRSECSSCHGPRGRQAIQSSHPWRQSCSQCHASSAWDDQWGRP